MKKLLEKFAAKTLPSLVKSKRNLLMLSCVIVFVALVKTHDLSPIINAIADQIKPPTVKPTSS